MSYWDSAKQEVVRFTPHPSEEYPGWWVLDCGCCGGLEWSAGFEPIPCSQCNESGTIALHVASNQTAVYPGGPFRGPPSKADLKAVDRARTAGL